MDILKLKSASDSAVIVLHEIYGVNQHIVEACSRYQSWGYDVYCPNLYHSREPFLYSQEGQAYQCFMENVGFCAAPTINALAATLQNQYRHVFLVGHSVGAKLAWICANEGIYSGVVCHYGSRIRDYLHVPPQAPTLALFSRQEASFVLEEGRKSFSAYSHVRVKLFDAAHSFCDKYGQNYDHESAEQAFALAERFLSEIHRVSP